MGEAFVDVKKHFDSPSHGGSILQDLQHITGIVSEKIAQRVKHERSQEIRQLQKAEQVLMMSAQRRYDSLRLSQHSLAAMDNEDTAEEEIEKRLKISESEFLTK